MNVITKRINPTQKAKISFKNCPQVKYRVIEGEDYGKIGEEYGVFLIRKCKMDKNMGLLYLPPLKDQDGYVCSYLVIAKRIKGNVWQCDNPDNLESFIILNIE